MTDTTTVPSKPAARPPLPAAAASAPPRRPAPEGPKLYKPLPSARFKTLRSSEADYGNQHGAVLPSDVSLEAALDPAFWQLVAGINPNLVRPNDIIELRWDDQHAFARLYVRSVDGVANVKSRVACSVLEHVEFGPIERVRDAVTHRVEYRGAHLKNCVVRDKDNEVVSAEHETPEAAMAALRNITRQTPPKG
jgi:hypothetical protein